MEIALKNRNIYSGMVVMMLINTFPDVLTFSDRSGASLLHRFCWLEHLTSHQVTHELEVRRGITGSLRSPLIAKDIKHQHAYSVVETLDALYLTAKR